MAQYFLQTCWWIPLYCLLGAIATIPWAANIIKRSGPRPAAYLNILLSLTAFIHGVLAFIAIRGDLTQTLSVNWLDIADLKISLSFELSPVSLAALTLVTFMSLIAQVYALGYMEKDWAMARFFGLLGFFEAALTAFSLSNSLFLSYGLLEMLTLSTLLLVGFWYAQPLVVTAARDAFLTKRVGDVLLLMGVISVSYYAKSLDFRDIYDWVDHAQISTTTATLLCLALIAGPTGKCAQFPLNLWLDEAMEGPAPASILRNSVVVSAGAYFLIKLEPVLILSPVACGVLVALGTITVIGSSLVSIAQMDIKRALSHSTSAYVGFVFIGVGNHWTNFALLVLLAHGVAKALLVTSQGSISLNSNCQNMSEMGGVWSRMPVTTTAFVVGSAGLVGLLPLGGFWAMREGIHAFRYEQIWIVALILLVNVLTAINLVRVFRLVFLGPSGPKMRRSPEANWMMVLPMVTLTVMTLLTPVFLGQLNVIPAPEYLYWDEIVPLMISGAVGCLIGAWMPLSRGVCPVKPRFQFLRQLLAYDFYLDIVYDRTVVAAVVLLSRLGTWCDRVIVDGLINFIGAASLRAGEVLRYSVGGQSQAYVLLILVSISFIGVFLTWSLW
ncbi:NAD(P)H-quinone oxidoreductase subunit F [Lyngbya confervoides]|uniref:NAD(P)H-quinone oxidoreductase subunit F n=1 Tax=Lyngbya confervoides BDU141951 TaxID=1574623 RepID=A0ABD4T323_9CYAN|nr:NAD(P)H-quinone oxidoreductase subunit F [Lyngbya confervoides]MCM1983049.1 NAD(P)H-quinone oxidoreductase subunit F [Lyngbya confervoides BDU141951]